jgi:arylsulfatase A
MLNINRREFIKAAGLGSLALTLPGKIVSQIEQQDKPNIILIMADDLGYECLGCYGSTSYKTPVLDRLAKTGMRFDHCYSQPLCTPSRVQIMTGRYNFRNYKMFGYFDIEEITFAHVLKKAGYSTCIAGKWQLSHGIEGPFHAGFDEYVLWQIHRKIAGEFVLGPRYADPKLYKNGKLMENNKGKYGPDVCCDFILDYIERKKSGPFMVYYPMILTHAPFVPTPDSPEWTNNRNEKNNKYFADMVSYMDKIIGRIVNKLDELGLRENTLILFTGDNGTHINIRSQLGQRWIQGGKSHMTDAGTHVPLVANWPGAVPSNSVCDDLVDFSDFLPTLVDLAQTSLPEDMNIDGQSFYPRLRGEKGTPREWVFMHYWDRGRDKCNTRRCARDKRWKLYDDGSFYDVTNDPLEENPISEDNVIGEIAAVREKLQGVLDRMK